MTTAVREVSTAFSRRVSKPWGHELITTPPDLPYTGKLLYIRRGCRLSLQSHDAKTETLTLVSGLVRITLENEAGALVEFEMDLGRGYTVYPDVRHRMTAAMDSVVMEASTPERGTTRRYDDDYGRDDELEADRAL